MAKSNPSPPNSLEAKLEFVEADKVSLSYACIICGNPLRQPILQLYCGHRGCGACVEQLRQSQDKSCPGGEPECKEVDVSKKGRYSVLICHLICYLILINPKLIIESKSCLSCKNSRN